MSESTTLSLQERYAPHGRCFGCGPANSKGLRVKSMANGDEVVATWLPALEHEAFPGTLNGGIIGTLLDCHCNWTAAYHLMRRDQCAVPPCTVTAEYAIKLLAPTPSVSPVELRASVISSKGRRVEVHGMIVVSGKVTAECRGVFVAVKEDHPAYHRW